MELNKSRQPSEEISKQTRSDRLWRKLIFSDTWHWDPLTSTQHNRRGANGERGAKASDKGMHSESMIRHCDSARKSDYAGNEFNSATNEDKSKGGTPVPVYRASYSIESSSDSLESTLDERVTFSAWHSHR